MILDKLADIETFVLDVDGVLTTGTVLATDDGEMQRDFNIKDGYAINYALKHDYNVIIISGGDSEGVRKRLKRLGIKEVHTAIKNKGKLLSKIENRLSINLNNALYMGDDLQDISVMNMCGVKVCPSDAVWKVKENCDIITKERGGRGAVREIFAKVFSIRENWESNNHAVW